jgi:hypothetical protein
LVHHAVLLEFDVPSFRTDRSRPRGGRHAASGRQGRCSRTTSLMTRRAIRPAGLPARPPRMPPERRSSGRQEENPPGFARDRVRRPRRRLTGSHRDLEISHRTRDSHISTSRSLFCLRREKREEHTQNERRCDPSLHQPAAGASPPRPHRGPARIVVANRQK